jgi:hypothetical protein
MVEPVERDSRGILHPRAALELFALERFAPSAAVARFVDRYWVVSSHLPDGQRHEQQVLVHPVVNIVFERDTATVTGVQVKRFTKVLTGRGRASSCSGQPGSAHCSAGPCRRSPAPRSRSPKYCPRCKISNSDPRLPIPPGEELSASVDKALAAILPAEPQACEQTTTWAARAANDRELRRVKDLATVAGISVRGLSAPSATTSESARNGCSADTASTKRRSRPLAPWMSTGPRWPPISGMRTRRT